MKAFVVAQYGKDGIRAADLPEPRIGNSDVLVRVSAASINPPDKMVRNGEFKQLLKYKPPFVIGHDVAGVVTQVGAGVRNFKVGDEVYARPRDLRIGAFAEYIAIDQNDVAPKPVSLTLHEAAAVPLVALAAWQILVEKAQVKPGQKVLVHAGAGGLGSTVIQLAKHLGAYVATTTNGDTEELVRELGADVVVDYTKQDFSEILSSYDLVLDSLGGENLMKSLTVLSRIRQTAWRPHALRACAVVPEPQGPRGGQEARCALLVLLHAGQWCAARRARRPLRCGPPPPGHRLNLRVRPDPRSARLRRERQSQGREGRRHTRLIES